MSNVTSTTPPMRRPVLLNSPIDAGSSSTSFDGGLIPTASGVTSIILPPAALSDTIPSNVASDMSSTSTFTKAPSTFTFTKAPSTPIATGISSAPGFDTIIKTTVSMITVSVSIAPSMATGTPSGVSTITMFPLPLSTSSTAKSTPIAAIAGGAVGGFLFLALLLTLFLFRRRIFWRSSNNNSSVMHRRTDTLSIDPFTSMTTAAVIGDTKSPNYALEAVPTPLLSANEKRGVNYSSERQPDPSLASLGPTAPLSALLEERVLPRDDTGGGRTDRTAVAGGSTAFQSRMQRIQNLVLELNREMEAGGDDSVQVAVLQGQTAEPIGEGAETEARDAWNTSRTSVATGTTILPPYEPRQT